MTKSLNCCYDLWCRILPFHPDCSVLVFCSTCLTCWVLILLLGVLILETFRNKIAITITIAAPVMILHSFVVFVTGFESIPCEHTAFIFPPLWPSHILHILSLAGEGRNRILRSRMYQNQCNKQKSTMPIYF